ncbi:MAG: hypothetical protein BIFFINMI_02705 [Phycisphaerae bacterium]|nr:hypothetical protein [Phycisphaerae bacterium]
MKSPWLSVFLLLVAASVIWLVTRGGGGGQCCSLPSALDRGTISSPDAGRPAGLSDDPPAPSTPTPGSAGLAGRRSGLPRLIDLGAKTCIPCKMMAPILEDLKKTHADQFVTEFIDVRENPRAGREHGIAAIPTQIFFDASGRELYRHEGFLSKDAILAKWKELGVPVH